MFLMLLLMLLLLIILLWAGICCSIGICCCIWTTRLILIRISCILLLLIAFSWNTSANITFLRIVMSNSSTCIVLLFKNCVVNLIKWGYSYLQIVLSLFIRRCHVKIHIVVLQKQVSNIPRQIIIKANRSKDCNKACIIILS